MTNIATSVSSVSIFPWIEQDAVVGIHMEAATRVVL